jgi:hypothetical protein
MCSDYSTIFSAITNLFNDSTEFHKRSELPFMSTARLSHRPEPLNSHNGVRELSLIFQSNIISEKIEIGIKSRGNWVKPSGKLERENIQITNNLNGFEMKIGFSIKS